MGLAKLRNGKRQPLAWRLIYRAVHICPFVRAWGGPRQVQIFSVVPMSVGEIGLALTDFGFADPQFLDFGFPTECASDASCKYLRTVSGSIEIPHFARSSAISLATELRFPGSYL